MKYIVVSAVTTDEIHFTDGTVKTVPGGAGIYALCGIRLWADDVTAVTGIGEDYKGLQGAWYEKNGLSMDGLMIKDAKSPYTVIQYFEDGERTETPRYGLEHFQKLETTGAELAPYLTGENPADGVYIFKNTDEKFWSDVLELRDGYKGKIMWEIGADAAYPENLNRVHKIACRMDIFSINMTEGKSLFGTDDREKVIEGLKSWGLPLIFLRQGAKGAVMITPDQTVEVPSQPDVNVVDPTGGGNSSTGGVLCGFVEGYSPEVCGRMGSISAAMCISQHGVPELITEEMRKDAMRRAGIAD